MEMTTFITDLQKLRTIDVIGEIATAGLSDVEIANCVREISSNDTWKYESLMDKTLQTGIEKLIVALKNDTNISLCSGTWFKSNTESWNVYWTQCGFLDGQYFSLTVYQFLYSDKKTIQIDGHVTDGKRDLKKWLKLNSDLKFVTKQKTV
tara:strand:+ start:92 stop:541 length:450 start_codon:yes stop_codon:yes gene_type:complete